MKERKKDRKTVYFLNNQQHMNEYAACYYQLTTYINHAVKFARCVIAQIFGQLSMDIVMQNVNSDSSIQGFIPVSLPYHFLVKLLALLKLKTQILFRKQKFRLIANPL
jgi:hypothetical protein